MSIPDFMKTPIIMEFWAERRDYCQRLDLYGRSGKSYLANVILETPENDHVRQEPMSLDGQTAQNLIDALYEAGYVPTKMRTENRTDIKNHLEDMRRLVFKEAGE